MNNTWKTELCQAAALTFEELCFLFPDIEMDIEQKQVSVDAAVRVTFWGPFNGSLLLKLYGGLLPGLAANMLGEDETPSEEQPPERDTYGSINANLFLDCYKQGAQKPQLVVKVAGGASVQGDESKDLFQIGKRNFVMLRKLLWKNGVLLKAHDVGGTQARTMTLDVDTGEVTLKIQGNTTNL